MKPRIRTAENGQHSRLHGLQYMDHGQYLPSEFLWSMK